jgi:hypothetical protein
MLDDLGMDPQSSFFSVCAADRFATPTLIERKILARIQFALGRTGGSAGTSAAGGRWFEIDI